MDGKLCGKTGVLTVVRCNIGFLDRRFNPAHGIYTVLKGKSSPLTAGIAELKPGPERVFFYAEHVVWILLPFSLAWDLYPGLTKIRQMNVEEP